MGVFFSHLVLLHAVAGVCVCVCSLCVCAVRRGRGVCAWVCAVCWFALRVVGGVVGGEWEGEGGGGVWKGQVMKLPL